MRHLLILALCAHAFAAVSLTNCQANVATTSSTVAITSFVLTTAGDGIFVWTGIGGITASTQTVSISDNGGGGSQTYTQAGSYTTGSTLARGAAFLVTNATSAVNGATITATWTSALTPNVVVCEITNAATSSLLDGTPAASAASMATSLTSGALTTTNSGTDLLIYCISTGVTSISAQTAGGSYAIPSGASSVHNACQALSVSGTQSGVTTSMSWTTSATEVVGLFLGVKQAATQQTPPLFVIQPGQ